MKKELVFPEGSRPFKIGDCIYYNGSKVKILAYWAPTGRDNQVFVKGYTIANPDGEGHTGGMFSYDKNGCKVKFPEGNAWFISFKDCDTDEVLALHAKELLEDFDVVVLRNGQKMYKCSNAFIAIDERDFLMFLNLIMYNNNLEYSSDSRKDVMQIWEPKAATKVNEFLNVMKNTSDNCDMNEYFNLQWQRNEFTEVTMNDIAKKFGIPVEQLKIKK